MTNESNFKHIPSASGGLAQMVERSLSMREVPGSIPGFSKFFFFENYCYFFFYFWPVARITNRVSAANCGEVDNPFQILASRLCRTCWGMSSLPSRRSGFLTRSYPTNVVSGTGTRDEPLRTSAWEASASAKIADFRSTEMSNVHLAGFSKPLPPNLQSCHYKNLEEEYIGTSI